MSLFLTNLNPLYNSSYIATVSDKNSWGTSTERCFYFCSLRSRRDRSRKKSFGRGAAKTRCREWETPAGRESVLVLPMLTKQILIVHMTIK